MEFESYLGHRHCVNFIVVVKCPWSNQYKIGLRGQKQSINSLTLCKYHIICQAHCSIILYILNSYSIMLIQYYIVCHINNTTVTKYKCVKLVALLY